MPHLDPMEDLKTRWVATPEQVRIARVMLAVCPDADTVIVALALPGKNWGTWNTGQPVEHVPGFWLAHSRTDQGPYAYRTARNAAEAAAMRHLAGRPGTVSFVSITDDGRFAAYEAGTGPHTGAYALAE